jgi:hypothetical protein
MSDVLAKAGSAPREKSCVEELEEWLRGAGSLAQEMLLYSRGSVDLVVRTESTPKGVLVTVWLFDGAGLAVFHRPGSGYDRTRPIELFAALLDMNAKQLVGTSPDTLLDALKRRLMRDANVLVDAERAVSGGKVCARSERMPSATAAEEYLAYEEHGLPAPLDIGAIAVRASEAFWAGRGLAWDLIHETFDGGHGFWEHFRFIGSRRYAKHWVECAPCRARLTDALAHSEDLLRRFVNTPPASSTFRCAGLIAAASTAASLVAHEASCLDCQQVMKAAKHQIEQVLSGQV